MFFSMGITTILKEGKYLIKIMKTLISFSFSRELKDELELFSDICHNLWVVRVVLMDNL